MLKHTNPQLWLFKKGSAVCKKKTSLSLPENFKIYKKADAGCMWKRR